MQRSSIDYCAITHNATANISTVICRAAFDQAVFKNCIRCIAPTSTNTIQKNAILVRSTFCTTTIQGAIIYK